MRWGRSSSSASLGALVIYMSAEKFMYEFVAAMRAKDTHSFKARLRASRRADDR